MQAHVTKTIFAHNIEIKIYGDKNNNFEPRVSMTNQGKL
jgi:hypothetical protein